MKTLSCPKGHGPMAQKKLRKQKTFKGVDIEYAADAFVCPECGLEIGTVQTAADIQRAIADAYRTKSGLLTGNEIRSLREGKGLTQQQLADVISIGVASIKRWETSMIQSKSMGHALRMHLQCDQNSNNYLGNRDISLPRIKLVAKRLVKILGRRLLKKADKML